MSLPERFASDQRPGTQAEDGAGESFANGPANQPKAKKCCSNEAGNTGDLEACLQSRSGLFQRHGLGKAMDVPF
jgi:hypothetical protein